MCDGPCSLAVADTCLLMGSSDWIPWFASFARLLLYLLNWLCLNPWVFFTFTFLVVFLHAIGWEWASGCVELSCMPGLNHNSDTGLSLLLPSSLPSSLSSFLILPVAECPNSGYICSQSAVHLKIGEKLVGPFLATIWSHSQTSAEVPLQLSLIFIILVLALTSVFCRFLFLFLCLFGFFSNIFKLALNVLVTVFSPFAFDHDSDGVWKT